MGKSTSSQLILREGEGTPSETATLSLPLLRKGVVGAVLPAASAPRRRRVVGRVAHSAVDPRIVGPLGGLGLASLGVAVAQLDVELRRVPLDLRQGQDLGGGSVGLGATSSRAAGVAGGRHRRRVS